MSQSAAERAAAAMADQQPREDYIYLRNKFGAYELELQSTKVKDDLNTILELKVLKASKLQGQSSDTHAVGDVVSYNEKVADKRSGAGSRMMAVLLALRHMTAAEISTFTLTRNGKEVELGGEPAKSQWLAKFLNESTQPCVFLRVKCEVYPKKLEAKGDPGTADYKPAKTVAGERWSKLEIPEAELDEIDARRAKVNLPSLADALTVPAPKPAAQPAADAGDEDAPF
jgi:hypothetical protein